MRLSREWVRRCLARTEKSASPSVVHASARLEMRYGTQLDRGGCVMRSGQAHALPLPPPPATPCALPCADDAAQRPPTAAWVPLEESVSLRVVVNCRYKDHARPEFSRPGGWRWGRVELHSARPLTSTEMRRGRIFLASAPPLVHRCRQTSTFSERRCRQNCRQVQLRGHVIYGCPMCRRPPYVCRSGGRCIIGALRSTLRHNFRALP
jgi:hypothetical protein